MSLQQLAEVTGAELIGDGACLIYHAADVAEAGEGDIAFVYTSKYAEYIQSTHASALVVSRNFVDQCSMPVLVSEDPRLTFAKAVAALHPEPAWTVGVSDNAFVNEDASVDINARVEDGAVIGAGVIISAGASIGANCVIGDHVTIGSNTRIHANSTIYHDCIIGDDCLIHSGVVIGADGFGFVKEDEGYFKVPQVGRVRIGNNVEIGACTSIDRGALSDTVIEDGVKIDNQIQIGHNVRIGHDSVVSACTCIAGSAKIGAHCMIGGSVGIRDNIEIVDHAVITGRTFVSNSITTAGVYSSSILMDTNENWRRNVARFKQLDDMAKRLKNLEKKSQ